MNNVNTSTIDMFNHVALTRLHLVSCTPTLENDPLKLATILAECAELGVRFTNPDKLTIEVAENWEIFIENLARMRGQERTYAPLFEEFPNKLPAWDDAELRFAMARGRLADMVVAQIDNADGEPVDIDDLVTDQMLQTALDFTNIAWWPASSIPQNIEKDIQTKLRQKTLQNDSHIQWLTLTIVSEKELQEAVFSYFQVLAYAPSAMRENQNTEFKQLLTYYGAATIDMERVRFKETRAVILTHQWRQAAENDDAYRGMVESNLAPDDLLRIFAAETETDVSLGKKISYPKFTRRQRRLVLEVLENSTRREDMWRRREIWLSVTKSLHAGEYAKRYPKTIKDVTLLRENRYNACTLAARFEHALDAKNIIAAATIAAQESPGLLFRNFRRVSFNAQTCGEEIFNELLAIVSQIKIEIPLRVLLETRKQIQDNGETYPRIAVAKTGHTMIVDNKKGHLALNDENRSKTLEILDVHIAKNIAQRASWENEKIWIEPGCDTLLTPDTIRTTSDGMLTLERGSRIKVDAGKVLRMFVHWREQDEYRSDLDLSCLILNEEFKVKGQISWTNLAAYGITHSGDVTSAPNGASEFIDIPLAKLDHKKQRYIAPVILRYSGPGFSQLGEAKAGWMMREKVSNKIATFDPKTTVNVVELHGNGGYVIPFVYDVVTQEIVYLDMYYASRYLATTEREGATIANTCRASMQRVNIKTSISELVKLHVKNRGGELVENRENATITFGVTNADTYNVLLGTKLVNDLL